MNKFPQIFLIDDNKIDLLINKVLIENINAELVINSFMYPIEAIQFFSNLELKTTELEKNIIFLDYCMPKLDGYQFMELFKEIDPSIKKHFEIYVVSSTIDPDEIKKIKDHECCKDFIYKPLNADLINSLIKIKSD